MLLEDIDLTQEQFYERLTEGADIHTSTPILTDFTELWDELLEEYDEIVHIPMSSGLSSTCSTAAMLAQDYEGKVFVVDNQRISVTQRQSVMNLRQQENPVRRSMTNSWRIKWNPVSISCWIPYII